MNIMMNARSKDYEVLEKTKQEHELLKEIENDEELNKHLDRMHRRWVARNLFGVEIGPEEEMRSYANANACMANGKSVLMTVLERNPESPRFKRDIHVLLYEGADVNEQNDLGQTFLMITCRLGFTQPAKAVLRTMRVNFFIRDIEGNTAMHFAAKYGRHKILKHMIKTIKLMEQSDTHPKGTSAYQYSDIFERRNKQEQTPLETATFFEQPTCIKRIEKEISKRKTKLKQEIGLIQHETPPFMDLLAVGPQFEDELLSDVMGSSDEEDITQESKEKNVILRKRSSSIVAPKSRYSKNQTSFTPQPNIRRRLATIATGGMKRISRFGSRNNLKLDSESGI